MDTNSTVVFDKTEFSEAVHKEVHTRPGCPDHLRQSLLSNVWKKHFTLSWLIKSGHKEENSCQASLARIEMLIDEIGLRSNTPGEQECQEQVGEGMLLMDHADHLLPLYLEHNASRDGGCSR